MHTLINNHYKFPYSHVSGLCLTPTATPERDTNDCGFN